MKRRIPPSEEIRQGIQTALHEGKGGSEHPLDGFVERSAQYMLQVAVEQEVSEYLGRGHYQRGARRIPGYRNGYERAGVATEAGRLEVKVPQVRDCEAFHSAVLEQFTNGTPALKRLVLSMYVRGLSVRDIEASFEEAFGARVLSKSAVSEVTQTIGEQFAQWQARDLSERRRIETALADARAAQADLQRRLTTLVAASGSLLVSPRLEDVLPAALNLANQLLEPDACAVWRLHPAEGAWRMESHQGLSETFALRIVATLRNAPPSFAPFSDPLVAEDVTATPILDERRQVHAEEGIKSMMAVPLQIGADRSGTLVFYYRTRHPFTDVEIETARALGNLVSATITTAELYDAQRRSRSQSEFLAEAASVLAGSLDYQDTLRRVTTLAVPHIADWCAVDPAPQRDGRIDGRGTPGRDRSAEAGVSPGARRPSTKIGCVSRGSVRGSALRGIQRSTRVPSPRSAKPREYAAAESSHG
jgi:hypothetical protein